jgi:hypothetical protein
VVVVVLAATVVEEVEVGRVEEEEVEEEEVEEEEVVEAECLFEQAARAAPATVAPATWRNLRRPNASEPPRGSAIGPHAKCDLRPGAANIDQMAGEQINWPSCLSRERS